MHAKAKGKNFPTGLANIHIIEQKGAFGIANFHGAIFANEHDFLPDLWRILIKISTL